MPPSKKKAMVQAVKEAAIEGVKIIPGTGILIESVRKYHESIEEQQREEFVAALSSQIDEVTANSEWYKSEQGENFVKKITATALNAEYADKIEYLANALVNGPRLGLNDAVISKYTEMVRQLSKPALDVLVAALNNPTGTGEVMPGALASQLRWSPELVDSCVRELHAIGAFSSVISWFESSGDGYRPSQFFSSGSPAVTSISRGLAAFISGRSSRR